MVQDNEIIVNMFAGVGTYSIVIATANKTCKIYSIDSNSAAAELCAINAKLNKVQDRVESIHGDAARVIKDRLAGCADRVLMPLPERAKEFVNDAVLALKPGGGIVHYFAHVKADNKKASQDAGLADAREAFSKYNYGVRGTRIVREVGPRLYQIVADVFATR
jgi:tRNA (guanine37-N1)-methyltransferase